MKPTHIDQLYACAKDKSWELKCDLQKLYPRLYLLKFDPNDSYDMCMTFVDTKRNMSLLIQNSVARTLI